MALVIPTRGSANFTSPVAMFLIYRVTLVEDLQIEDHTTVGDTYRVLAPGGMSKYSGEMSGWIGPMASSEETFLGNIRGDLKLLTTTGDKIEGPVVLLSTSFVYNFGSKGTKGLPFSCRYEFAGDGVLTGADAEPTIEPGDFVAP